MFRSPTPRACDDRALVLLAVGIASVMRVEGGLYSLLVAPADATRAATELEQYTRENRPPLPPAPQRLHAGAAIGAGVYALIVFACGVASSRSFLGRDWFGSGVLTGGRFRAGELWRAATALTLHVDLAHLAANVGFGALFGGLAARVYGAGWAWLLILLAAVAANAFNGWTMPAEQVSLGASTAVFAALGALAVHRWAAASRRARAGRSGASMVAALVLLALLGTGDARTDTTAHALGFGFGALLALPLRRWPAPWGARPQWLAGAAAIALLAGAWASAFWS